MRITSTGSGALAPAAGPTPVTAVDSRAPSSSAGAAPAALQSDVMKPALAAMAALPEIDTAKVEALRDALARGDIRFDAARLAGLIERFHGGGR
ncbi:flagellar biosynthesis anti-sigma factor FlgM [Caldimonas brevitalea]|uniref:Negative regulator of flagellin synthesis n=1 Tax=Caldimonas brevitalea TaxID=413882 RepID=A0A0G3BLT5_9BURK|nr:flagellar biosynthesis anti-sigma factor FlgM [Caldimonas brevitalea]AKJ30357.1 negative regulator of flagellin synthesis FlgM [Caldimonas brevitalea]